MGLGHASVIGAVGPPGIVELPVANGGGVVVAFEDVDTPVDRMEPVRENDPVRSPWPKLGVNDAVELPVGVGGGIMRMVERSPVGKDGTVDQLIDTSGTVVLSSKGRVVGGINVTLPVGKESVMFAVAVTIKLEKDPVVLMVTFDEGMVELAVPVLAGGEN